MECLRFVFSPPIHSPAAWQNLVTRFLAILCYHHFLGYLGLENGKTQ